MQILSNVLRSLLARVINRDDTECLPVSLRHEDGHLFVGFRGGTGRQCWIEKGVPFAGGFPSIVVEAKTLKSIVEMVSVLDVQKVEQGIQFKEVTDKSPVSWTLFECEADKSTSQFLLATTVQARGVDRAALRNATKCVTDASATFAFSDEGRATVGATNGNMILFEAVSGVPDGQFVAASDVLYRLVREVDTARIDFAMDADADRYINRYTITACGDDEVRMSATTHDSVRTHPLPDLSSITVWLRWAQQQPEGAVLPLCELSAWIATHQPALEAARAGRRRARSLAPSTCELRIEGANCIASLSTYSWDITIPCGELTIALPTAVQNPATMQFDLQHLTDAAKFLDAETVSFGVGVNAGASLMWMRSGSKLAIVSTR